MASDYSRLHKWHHDDYEVAKRDIAAQIGDIDECEIFGRQVLVAVYIRPAYNPNNGITYTEVQQKEDIAQGKAVLVLKLGPDAFSGDESYLKSMFGENGPPKPGDWLFVRSAVGEPMQICGEGADRAMYRDKLNREHEAYPFEGWPCRVISDESFIGRVAKPHQVV